MQKSLDERIFVRNPVAGFIAFGLGSAAFMCVGTAIFHRPLRKQALVVLTGGSIIGVPTGIAGAYLMPGNREDHSNFARITLFFLQAAAAVLTPFIGEAILKYDIHWYYILVDQLVGVGIVIGGSIFLVVFLFLVYTICNGLIDLCCLRRRDDESSIGTNLMGGNTSGNSSVNNRL
jgi:hypothetical protein